jgi:anthranilate phosphoribosyltransferase
MDELSTLGENHIVRLTPGGPVQETLHTADLGFAPTSLADLAGGDAAHNADILEGILSCRIKGPKRDIAVLNAAAGFVITGKATTLAEGKHLAEELLDRGAAHAKLRALQEAI